MLVISYTHHGMSRITLWALVLQIIRIGVRTSGISSSLLGRLHKWLCHSVISLSL